MAKEVKASEGIVQQQQTVDLEGKVLGAEGGIATKTGKPWAIMHVRVLGVVAKVFCPEHVTLEKAKSMEDTIVLLRFRASGTKDGNLGFRLFDVVG